jgi:hypothetical protein
MIDERKFSHSNLPELRPDAFRKGARRTDLAGVRALEPVVQSAVGVVRESAGLLYHIAGLGIALLSGPQNFRPKHRAERTDQAAPHRANVIPFPGSKCRTGIPSSTGNRS